MVNVAWCVHPSSVCTSLQQLELNGNAFNGTFPTTLMAMPSLRMLDLCDTRLSGDLPSMLSTLTRMNV
jgi:hypothetical protein